MSVQDPKKFLKRPKKRCYRSKCLKRSLQGPQGPKGPKKGPGGPKTIPNGFKVESVPAPRASCERRSRGRARALPERVRLQVSRVAK